MKRKDVEHLARELVDAIGEMRTQMARQDAIIQRQAAEIRQWSDRYFRAINNIEPEW